MRVSQIFYCKLEVKTLDDSFQRFVYHFFVYWHNISFFPLAWIYIPLSMQWLKMNFNDLQMQVLHIFIMRILVLSRPSALFGSSIAITLSMSSSVVLTEDNLSFVLQDKVRGSRLLLLIKQRWFAKNELNSSAFFEICNIFIVSKQIQNTWNFFLKKGTFQNGPKSLKTFTKVK